jgi:hypothetical protein
LKIKEINQENPENHFNLGIKTGDILLLTLMRQKRHAAFPTINL